MDNNYAGISCAFYTVKQLAALFGKSEDTIRRWKNEGIGKDEDNIKLRAIEREDGRGRKNVRHLTFSREAVMDFVRANPFLMDDAPQLGLMMQAEGAWAEGALPMPGSIGGLDIDEDGKTDIDGKGQTGFMGQLRRVIDESGINCGDDEDDDIFAGFENRGTGVSHGDDKWEFPHFERRQPQRDESTRHNFESARERLRRHFAAEDDFTVDEDWGDAEEDFEPWDNSGWKNPMPKPGPGQRKKIDEELQRRMKVIRFGLSVVEKERGAIEARREEMEKVKRNVQLSGMDIHSINSVIDVMNSQLKTMEEQMDMLEEFISVIEADIDED